MGKIDLKSINREKILWFLQFESNEVKEGGIIFIAIWSVVDFWAALLFLEYKVLWGIIFIVPSFFIIKTLTYFKKKMEHSKRNEHFFYALYSGTVAIGNCVLAYALMKQSLGEDIWWLWVGFILGIVSVGIISFYNYYAKINTGYYEGRISRVNALTTSGLMVFFLVIRPVYAMADGYMFFGILLAVLGIIFPVNVSYFFLKAYYYDYFEKEEQESKIPEDNILFVEDSNCNLCDKAKQWLKDNNVEYVSRNLDEIKLRDPEIRNWHSRSDVPISRFFDPNSVIYKRMKLKDRLPNMTDEEPYDLLVKNNSLLKLPILVSAGYILIGFRENEWEEKLIHKK